MQSVSQKLPDGRIRKGLLAGKEPEIRQVALIKSIGGFLQKNPKYIDARNASDKLAMETAMKICAATTLRYSKAQIARELSHQHSRFTPLDDTNCVRSFHPSSLRPDEWSREAKADLIMEGVRHAVRVGALSPANASIALMVCESSLTVGQIAKLTGISPSAVSQQLQRVRKCLPNILENLEPPSDMQD